MAQDREGSCSPERPYPRSKTGGPPDRAHSELIGAVGGCACLLSLASQFVLWSACSQQRAPCRTYVSTITAVRERNRLVRTGHAQMQEKQRIRSLFSGRLIH